MDVLPCLKCRGPLNVDEGAREHVINNAIGGMFATRNATCDACNHNQPSDAYLSKHFEIVCTFFDVVRDRGKRRPARYLDEVNGYEYEQKPGGRAELVPKLKVDAKKADGSRAFNVVARSAEEARQLIRKAFGPHAIIDEHDLVVKPGGTSIPPSLIEYNFSELMLQAVAKIAATFARAANFPLSAESVVSKYLRGELPPQSPPVGGVFADVIRFRDPEEITKPHPRFSHGIVVVKAAGPSPVVAYVWLFEFCEYSVLLDVDVDGPEFSACHFVNLISGHLENHAIDWMPQPAVVVEWTRRREALFARHAYRGRWIEHYWRNPNDFWRDRAVMQMWEEFGRLKLEGKTDTRAAEGAIAVFDKCVAKHNLRLKMSFDMSRPAPDR